MSLGSHLMTTPCSFNFKPPIHLFLMPSLIPIPSSSIHESCQIYISYSIIYMSIITQSYSANMVHSGNIKQPKHSTVSPSISLRLRGLAQARHARSGEPPPRLGENAKNKGMGNTGSRLSEIPLAWASCLLAQKLSEPPGRRFAQKT